MKNSTRITVDLSHDWEFLKSRAGRCRLSGSRPREGIIVDLPHCWNARDAFQENVLYYRGHGSYLKTFTMPGNLAAVDTLIWTFESEGFYGTGDIWLNGHKLAAMDGQYLGFSIAAGRDLRLDSENTLGIRLTNRCRSHVLPGINMPDFLLYGGLSGRLWLQGIPSLHLDRKRTRLCCGNVTDSAPMVDVHFAVANCSDFDRHCTIQWVLTDLHGNEVSQAESHDLNVTRHNDSGNLVMRLAVPRPRLWSPEDPQLYRAVCRIFEDGKLIDHVEERFGMRAAVFKPGQGFFLNGKRVELRGCNRHESMPGFGNALPEKLHRDDAALIRKLGCNFVRLSHYPQHSGFLDACDELGLMVYAEIATWKSVRTGRWLKSACRQMHDMIVRDRNRPSVVLWGMGNESRSRRVYLRLRDVARRLDPDRPVIYAENHFYLARKEKTVGIPDVWGVNYEFDTLDDSCNASRLKSVIVSECSNYPYTVREDPVSEAMQVAVIESDLSKIERKPYVAGFALWCFNDYATLRKKRYKRHSGIVDAWRVPKMASALMQAKYSNEPFVKLFGNWGEDGDQGVEQSDGQRETEKECREIHIFTNCDRVVVSKNGTEIFSLNEGVHFVRRIDFEPGELLATGVWKDRKTTDRLVSYTEARCIEVQMELAEANAALRETAGITIRILDKCRMPVASWNGHVKVAVKGPAFLRSYRSDNTVLVAAGIGRSFITSQGKEGVVSVKALYGLLDAGEATIHFR